MPNKDITAATAPFDFRLSNQQDQTVLYTRLQQQDMTLELHNTSRSQLTVAASQPAQTKSPIETNWHFQLRFRSGTLWEPGKIKLDDKDKANWLLTSPHAGAGETTSERPGDVILYLRYRGVSPLPLEPGDRIPISLQNIAVDGRAGSHGTRVELKYQQLQSAGNTKSLSGTRMHYLSVLDESPADEPGTGPILIDWAGPNTFLNDGTETTRILRLYNQSGHKLKLDAAAKITIDLPVGDPSAGWALIQEADKEAVHLETVTFSCADKLSGSMEQKKWKKVSVTPEIVAAADSPLVSITIPIIEPQTEFPTEAQIDIPITLKTKCRSGPAFIKIHYEGFAHLQGTRHVPVEKTPLVISPAFPGESSITPGQLHVGKQALVVDDAGNVGIGKNDPRSKLDIGSCGTSSAIKIESPKKSGGYGIEHSSGDAYLRTWVKNPKQANIEVPGTLNLLATDSLRVLTTDKNLVRLMIDSEGNVGIGTSHPKNKLDVEGSVAIGAGYSGTKKGPDDGLIVKGNVGIGTSTPGFPLTMPNTVGDKISLFGQSGKSWGFGIQPGLLQIHSDTVNGDVAFGFGSSAKMTETMRIKGNGNVGIGTTPREKAKLEINGRGSSQKLNSVYLQKDADNYWNPGGNADAEIPLADYRTGHDHFLSIYATDDIAAHGFASHSDGRIKTIEGRSDGPADLITLSAIEITDYTYKDVIAKGREPHKKVIAQQVETVYPQAVNKVSDVVPDIYENATVKEGWVNLATDLKVGERVRLIAEKEEGIHKVLEVRDGAFRTPFQPTTENVFVYGREVNDFGLVDYEAISMLNVSATQELARQLEAKESEIAELKKQLAEQGARLSRLEQFEARLARLENARSESLEHCAT